MIAFALAVVGVAAILAAEIVGRRLAPGYTVGRTLAAAPQVSIEQALALAARDKLHYVRVHGRVSSDEEFPDEHDRPLVYRRKRIETRDGAGRWRTAQAETEGVPFGVESRSSYIYVDSAKLTYGLVVTPRHSEGVAADLPTDMAGSLPPRTPARLVVEQVSAVEHAFVCGVPRRDEAGQPMLSAGLQRPLILTTLELPAAMRLLGGARGAFVVVASVLLLIGVVALILAVAALMFRLH